MALPPRPRLPSDYWGVPSGTHVGQPNRLGLDALFVLLGKLHAVAVGEQLLLLAIVFLAGLGMHRCVSAASGTARVFAGVLYAINPFVYDRLWTGQWFLLLGYALLPWAWAAFVRLVRGEGGDPFVFGVLAALVGIASAHMAALLVLVCVLTLAADFSRRGSLRGVLGLGCGALLSLYWLIPLPGVGALWARVGHAQLQLYSSVPAGKWGVPATLAGLGGFWNDTSPVSAFVPVWPLAAAALLVLAVAGLVLRRRDPVAWAVAAAGLVGVVLALGYGWGPTRGAFGSLLGHVPPLRSFRESQKGIALLVLAYAYLGAAAVDRLRGRRLVAVALIVVPLVLGFRTVGGLWGKLEPSSFPAGWSDARAALDNDDVRQSRTLFLPWSGYLELSFAHYRLVANPAPAYFATPILASRSVGEAAISDTRDPVESRVRALLADPPPNFASCLAALGVGHVLLAHEIGALDLDNAFRGGFAGITREQSWPGIDLYRVERPAGLAMERRSPGGCAPMTPVRVRAENPARYELARAVPSSKLVLGLPDETQWRVDGRTAEYRAWPQYERNYALGGLGVIVFAALAVRRRPRR